MIRHLGITGIRGPPLFYVDFILFPLIAVALMAGWWRSAIFGLETGLGILLFSFIEYWVHRIALHRFLYHGRHERHHQHPAEYVTFPVWYVPAIFFGFFLAMPLGIFCGVVLGYCWFNYWHHILHHFDLTKWPRPVQRYAIWHLSHHRNDDCNFGITLPIWDFLFGTYLPI